MSTIADIVLTSIGVIAVAITTYLVIALPVAITNAQNQMNWCQYKQGQWAWSTEGKKDGTKGLTGKRWSPNPLTLGLTGDCVNPGDKGL